MRLADYKIKLFDFVAGNLRRLAEFLSVKSLTEKDDFTVEETLSPLEDWRKKTRNVAPENWFEFAGGNEIETTAHENEFEPETQPIKISSVNENGEDFVLGKPKKRPPIEQFSENSLETSKKTETSNSLETSLTEKPEKLKRDSRFFSFRLSDKKTKQETDEPLKSLSKISHKSAEKAAEKPGKAVKSKAIKSNETAKPKFRLLPAEFVSKRKPKISDSTAPNIVKFAEKQSPPKLAVPTFERKKSPAIKIEETVPKPKTTIERAEPIVKKPSARREFSNQFPLESFSRKSESETATEINFRFPKRKTDSAIVSTSKAKVATESPNFSSPWEKSETIVQEYIKPAHGKKTGNAESFVAAKSPWTDLPDEPAFAATGDIQSNLSESEHLRFLESEQAGKA